MKVHVAVLWPPKTTAPIAVTYDNAPDCVAVLVEPVCFRVGGKLGRTVYAQLGDEPSEKDLLVGLMETPYMAGFVAEALTARFGG